MNTREEVALFGIQYMHIQLRAHTHTYIHTPEESALFGHTTHAHTTTYTYAYIHTRTGRISSLQSYNTCTYKSYNTCTYNYIHIRIHTYTDRKK